MIKKKKYACVKQKESKDCGVACLATISLHYGVKTTISQLRKIIGTDKEGSNILGLVNASKEMGLNAKAVRVKNLDDLFVSFTLPCIAHLKLENNFQHYVVIHKINKDSIVVADPAKGIEKYSRTDFLKIWSGVLVLLYPNETFGKVKATRNLFSEIAEFLYTQKGYIIGVFILSILATVLGIISAFHFRLLIDKIIPTHDNNFLSILSVGMIAVIIFKVIFDFFRNFLLVKMSQNIDVFVLLGYYKHIIGLPMNFFCSRNVGDIISRFADGNKIREAISSLSITVMVDVLMALIAGGVLISLNIKLFLICYIPILLYVLLVMVYKKTLEKLNMEMMTANSEMTSYLIESIEGIETVKSYNAENHVKGITEKKFHKFIKKTFEYGYVTGIQSSLKSAIKMVFGVVILWIGGVLVLNEEITVGTLISFNALLSYFIEPIESLTGLQPKVQAALVAAERLNDDWELDIEHKGDCSDNNTKSLLGDISLTNICFKYGNRKLVLNNINMDICRGEKVALVGESGSGKTTIVRLLMKFYDIQAGSISINGTNIDDIGIAFLRDRIAYISQENFFFSGTIKENMQIINRLVTDEELIEVCKKVELHDFIQSLPFKYDTILEEKGGNLSGGQRQRLSIARALLKNPDILIMDETTSNLDAITENTIIKTINEYIKDITVIIITHRLSTIKRCDKIFVLRNGQMIESGTHNDLINKKNYYFNLWNEQMQID